MLQRIQRGRFFIRKKSRYAGKEYYHESGVEYVGTPEETEYINWTRYLDEAHGFRTVKTAKRMAAIIWERYGQRVDVVNRNGEVVA
jgi:hypothetical protein